MEDSITYCMTWGGGESKKTKKYVQLAQPYLIASWWDTMNLAKNNDKKHEKNNDKPVG